MIEQGKVIMACNDLGLNYCYTPGIIYIMYQKKTEAFFKGAVGTNLCSLFASGYLIGLVLDEHITNNKIMYKTLRSIKEFEKDKYGQFNIIDFDYNTGLEDNIRKYLAHAKKEFDELELWDKKKKIQNMKEQIEKDFD